MKLLTLNTHSLIEKNYLKKLDYFINAIYDIKPDIIALQEVNQTSDNSNDVKKDNHILNITNNLEKMGIKYYWKWIPIKNGYNRYDEGIGVMSLSPIIETDTFFVSETNDYNNWKTRKILGILTENSEDWFYTVHYGWWNDKEEPFLNQWNKTLEHLKNKKSVWLMGDFNNTPGSKGYKLIESCGWYDSYNLAQNKDSGITVGNVIDGWKDKINDTDGMRIDQIWHNKEVDVKSSKVIFNDINYPIVSDHYGVLIEI